VYACWVALLVCPFFAQGTPADAITSRGSHGYRSAAWKEGKYIPVPSPAAHGYGIPVLSCFYKLTIINHRSGRVGNDGMSREIAETLG